MHVGETTVVAISGAKIGASAGLLATAVIFTDPAYWWMAIAGAFMGFGSAFHTIFSEDDIKFNKHQIIAVLLKSFMLGVISMPLLFLGIQEGLFVKLLSVQSSEISVSLSIAIAFAGSWYFIPIVDVLVDKFRGKE